MRMEASSIGGINLLSIVAGCDKQHADSHPVTLALTA